MDALVCVLDAEDRVSRPERMEDPLWLAQLRHSDFALLGKTRGLEPGAVARLREMLARERKPVIDIDAEAQGHGMQRIGQQRRRGHRRILV